MHQNSHPLSKHSLWQNKTTLIANLLLLTLCIFFTSQSVATTNVKGVEIIFVTEETLSEQSIAISIETQNNLWHRIQQGYAIPTNTSTITKKFEDFYAERPEYVDKMMERAEKYLFYVVEEVEKRGMPTEIALLPMIESAYNPEAYSRSHAVGIWQFVPATGKYFGLEQNWWADYRRDIVASTQAALDYLEKLHGMFGSWDLALAAYNAGEGTVSRAITRNQREGLATDYASLRLPPETVQYVPKLQAIKNIVTNPEQYGLQIKAIQNQAYFATVIPPFQIDAKVVASLAEISLEEFALLNPSYKRPIIASRHSTHKIILPVTAVNQFQINLENYDESLTKWSVYDAKIGENIASIANKFNISLEKLLKINSLSDHKKLSNARHLLVPTIDGNADEIDVAQLANQTTVIKAKRKHIKVVTHKIKRGETLSMVAKKYGTNTRTLMKVNRLKSSMIKAGQVITIKSLPEKTKRI